MSTSSAEVLSSRSLRAVAAALSCCLALAGCSDAPTDDAPPAAPGGAASGAAAPAGPVPAELLEAFAGVLQR
ncbi:MAG: hypothetical protein JWM84_1754, partial [Nocardioides sp.]|nr:hypothetical protein [Nocardioides sp.]